MPKKVSGTPNRQPRKPRRRTPVREPSTPAGPVRQTPVERPRVETPARPYASRVRAPAAPVVEYHYVIEDLKRVGIIAVAMFAVLGVLAVLLH